MPVIKVRENESFDVALRRFKRSCEKAGILAEVRAREFYEKPTTIRKREKATLAKRHAKRNARENARNTRLYELRQTVKPFGYHGFVALNSSKKVTQNQPHFRIVFKEARQ